MGDQSLRGITTCKDKLDKTIVLCCYGVTATTEKEIFIVALREALGAVCTLLKEYIMLLSCWVITSFCESFLMIDLVSRSCYLLYKNIKMWSRAVVSVWYKYVNKEAIGWSLWIPLE